MRLRWFEFAHVDPRRRAAYRRRGRISRIVACAVAVLISIDAALADPFIQLGPSDGLALDQPRVAVEVFDISGPTPQSMGPEFFNTFLLDTGASGILAVDGAVTDLTANGYQTVAIYDEQGVAGTEPMGVSEAYQFDLAGTNGIRQTLPEVRILSNSLLNFGSFNGIVGMPAMVQRVTSLDLTVWSDLSELFMGVDFPSTLPPATAGVRFEVPLTLFEFPLTGQRDPDDPLPTSAPLPFAAVKARYGPNRLNGSFIIDTGAQISIFASATAFLLGMDEDGNGSFDEEKLFDLPVGGIGGEIEAPVLAVDALSLQTSAGINLEWTDLSVAIIDIDPAIAGIVGMDLLTSGWFEKFVGVSQDDGFIEQIHFDFRNADVLEGAMFLDINPSLNWVQFDGDANGDGIVNAGDYTVWANNFGQTGQGVPGDLNYDELVNAGDYTIWANDFGGVSGPAGSFTAAVPEPSAMWLALWSLLCLLLARRPSPGKI